MREIKYIVIHCTATAQNAKVESIQKYWREVMGWKTAGYHYLIEANGKEHNLQPIEKPSNGVAGFNSNSIHVSYIGGIDSNGKPLDNRTPQQKETLIKRVNVLKAMYPNAIIQGHRDFPNVKKSCPSFDVKAWVKTI